MNKLWLMHTMEYYTAIKKKELPFHTTAWVNLRHIILNEGSHVYEKIYTVSSQSSRTSVVHGGIVTRCKGGMVVLARKEPERTFWGDGRIVNIDLDDGCPYRYKTHQAISLRCVHLIFVYYTLKNRLEILFGNEYLNQTLRPSMQSFPGAGEA